MIDAIDRSILRSLQKDGRMTATALAAEVGLTVAPCHRRLKDLEADGVIRGYRADVDLQSVGLGFGALVFVTLRETSQETIRAFEDAVVAEEQIVEAYRLFGDPDYLLKCVATDLAGFQALYDTHLAALPGVAKLSSTIVMRDLKGAGVLPL
ncbi:Lrp/AsnC family transcriptional regulator [Arthrobacter sp. RAF14]|uniref:Lrp/AsnC family transcriptional regulator n=1 Tax=Arthrobacter sp. RAF14 TaxID=3233051 RepID=UPI003F92F0CF